MGCVASTNSASDVSVPLDVPCWSECKPFVPPLTTGVVIKVYDGDTFTLASKLPFETSPLYRFPIRIRGIDAPEMRSKNPRERSRAQTAQQALEKRIHKKTVLLRNLGTEKYGRVLADVFLDECDIGQFMISSGFATPYDGKKKQAFEESQVL